MHVLVVHNSSNSAFLLPSPDVDEVDYEFAPREKRPRLPTNSQSGGAGLPSGGEDTGAEADNEKSENETEGDQGSLTGMNSQEEEAVPTTSEAKKETPLVASGASAGGSSTTPKRKKVLVARPFGFMRGHTAFLTFATAGNKRQLDPNDNPAAD